jgi:hypothetical protein
MFLLFALVACDAEPTACDTMAAYSVNVTVDAAAADIVAVTYTVDGVDKGACDAMPGGTYACGVEVAGHFVVTANVHGFVPTSAEADVAQGECHVEPASITIHPEDCESVSDAIHVRLSGADGGALVNPAVLWIASGGDADEACALMDDDGAVSDWTCAEQATGDFVVTGVADGYAPASLAVSVPDSDFGCGPETQDVDLVLSPLG